MFVIAVTHLFPVLYVLVKRVPKIAIEKLYNIAECTLIPNFCSPLVQRRHLYA
jgi:hypothetical protein